MIDYDAISDAHPLPATLDELDEGTRSFLKWRAARAGQTPEEHLATLRAEEAAEKVARAAHTDGASIAAKIREARGYGV